MSNQTIAQWLDNAVAAYMPNQNSIVTPFSLREALRSAVHFGMEGENPPNFQFEKRYQAEMQENLRLQTMVDLSKTIMAEKDQQIRLYKEATNDLPLYEVKERLDNKAYNSLKESHAILTRRISELQVGRDARIDELEALLQRQRDRIAALESNPENEEARFNIERQYEREMTNVSHLSQRIFDQDVVISQLRLRTARLQSEVDGLMKQRDVLRKEFEDYQQRNPDHEKALKEAAERIANSTWRGYRPEKSNQVNLAVENYLKDPTRLDSE